MPDPMTAEALYNLVSQWPEGARSEFVTYEVGKTTDAHGGDEQPFPMWLLDLSGLSIDEDDGEAWKNEDGDPDDDAAAPCPVQYAIALHEASGIRWLCTTPTLPVRIYTVGVETWWAVDFDSVRPGHFQAPTLIEAISAAIMATAKGEEK
jgi:hypothetical protein